MPDLVPTLSSISGQAVSADRAIDGMYVRDALLGHKEARSPREDLSYCFERQPRAVRSGHWKPLPALEEPGSRHPHFEPGDHGGPARHSVMDDPRCLSDLAADQPDSGAMNEGARPELDDRGIRAAASVRRDRKHVHALDPAALRIQAEFAPPTFLSVHVGVGQPPSSPSRPPVAGVPQRRSAQRLAPSDAPRFAANPAATPRCNAPEAPTGTVRGRDTTILPWPKP